MRTRTLFACLGLVLATAATASSPSRLWGRRYPRASQGSVDRARDAWQWITERWPTRWPEAVLGRRIELVVAIHEERKRSRRSSDGVRFLRRQLDRIEGESCDSRNREDRASRVQLRPRRVLELKQLADAYQELLVERETGHPGWARNATAVYPYSSMYSSPYAPVSMDSQVPIHTPMGFGFPRYYPTPGSDGWRFDQKLGGYVWEKGASGWVWEKDKGWFWSTKPSTYWGTRHPYGTFTQTGWHWDRPEYRWGDGTWRWNEQGGWTWGGVQPVAASRDWYYHHYYGWKEIGGSPWRWHPNHGWVWMGGTVHGQTAQTGQSWWHSGLERYWKPEWEHTWHPEWNHWNPELVSGRWHRGLDHARHPEWPRNWYPVRDRSIPERWNWLRQNLEPLDYTPPMLPCRFR